VRFGRLIELAKNPSYAARLAAYKVYERLHPMDPWIAPDAVKWCNRNLERGMRAWEFGSGRSTAWFADRVGKLTSIEHDLDWYYRVKPRLGGNVDYRLIPLDHPANEPTRPHYDSLPAYVAAVADQPDGSLDFVVVDGHYRQACILAVVPKIRSGGLLLLDNSDWLAQAEWGVPDGWPIVHRSSSVMGTTTIWRRA
jgi:hypothetical protein